MVGSKHSLGGDLAGGTAGMLVALPSTIAYGLMCFAPLGPQYAAMAAIGAVLGTVPICFISPMFRGIKILISAPTAATAAVISVYVAELVKAGKVPLDAIPIYVTMVGFLAGLLQIVTGMFGGGKFIKYIPYPVIAGYLSGLSVLVIMGQLPRLMGVPKDTKLIAALQQFDKWKWECICIGTITMAVMWLSRKYIKRVPAVISGLLAGIAAYWIIALFKPELRHLEGNGMVLGELPSSAGAIISIVSHRLSLLPSINVEALKTIIVPSLTIMLLLSVNTLNTCLILDSATYDHHNPKKELSAQGVGNIFAGLLCGIPAAGILTSSIENYKSGGKTHWSVVFAGINTLLVLLLCAGLVAWIPIPALGGILIMVAFSLIDFTILAMIKYRSTAFDFLVVLTVVIAAAQLDLIRAAGVGIAMAILMFLKQQMGATVIRRKILGNQVFSKKVRPDYERTILEEKGGETVIFQLHGQLFFGTTDQLFSKLEPHLPTCRYVILDMHRIQSIDYTAATMLKKILTRIAEKNGMLLFSSLPEVLATGQRPVKYLRDIGILQNHRVKLFDDMDAAIMWAEDMIIAQESSKRTESKILELPELEFFKDFSKEFLHVVGSCLEEKSYRQDDTIFCTGDKSDEMYFVRRGNIRIVLQLNDGKQFHLQTIGLGGIFGEMAFIDTTLRSAHALSADDSQLYVLSRDKFDNLTKTHPEMAGIFFERLALLIANRLRQTTKELKFFQEN